MTDALWDLVARGLVTADGFGSVRALFSARQRWSRRAARPGPGERLRRSGQDRAAAKAGGRWYRPRPPPARSTWRPSPRRSPSNSWRAGESCTGISWPGRPSLFPWREVLWAVRQLEARGTIRGGRFVTGFVGEQYALPDAVEGLRDVRRQERSGETVRVAAVDPLNLVGILTPGPRIPAVRRNAIVYHDGIPASPGGAADPRPALGVGSR